MEDFSEDYATQNDIGWGKLQLPEVPPAPVPKEAARIVLFGSTLGGICLLESLLAMQTAHNWRIVGMATDDALDPRAKISAKKRIWRFYTPEQKAMLQNHLAKRCSQEGIPLYTGPVKSDYFLQLITEWAPHLNLMCCFGQRIDVSVFTFSPYGMYNFHPSNLMAKEGQGPKPYSYALANGLNYTRTTLHGVSHELDEGPIVALSPYVYLKTAAGTVADNPLLVDERMTLIVPELTRLFMEEWLPLFKAKTCAKMRHLSNLHTFNEQVCSWLLAPMQANTHPDYPLPGPQHRQIFEQLKQQAHA